MVYCRPATQFCCGCTITIGAKVILSLHFLANLLLIVATFLSFFVPGFTWIGSDRLYAQVSLAGFAVVGLPFILLGAWGVIMKREVLLRLYFFYLLAYIGVAFFIILCQLVLTGACQFVSTAFTCGISRGVSLSAAAVLVSILCYFAHVVWSHCEDLDTGSGCDFSNLMVDDDVLATKRMNEDYYGSMLGSMEHMPYEYGSMYSTEYLEGAGMAGSKRVFGGQYHELRYPPPKAHGLRIV